MTHPTVNHFMPVLRGKIEDSTLWCLMRTEEWIARDYEPETVYCGYSRLIFVEYSCQTWDYRLTATTLRNDDTEHHAIVPVLGYTADF